MLRVCGGGGGGVDLDAFRVSSTPRKAIVTKVEGFEDLIGALSLGASLLTALQAADADRRYRRVVLVPRQVLRTLNGNDTLHRSASRDRTDAEHDSVVQRLLCAGWDEVRRVPWLSFMPRNTSDPALKVRATPALFVGGMCRAWCDSIM